MNRRSALLLVPPVLAFMAGWTVCSKLESELRLAEHGVFFGRSHTIINHPYPHATLREGEFVEDGVLTQWFRMETPTHTVDFRREHDHTGEYAQDLYLESRRFGQVRVQFAMDEAGARVIDGIYVGDSEDAGGYWYRDVYRDGFLDRIEPTIGAGPQDAWLQWQF